MAHVAEGLGTAAGLYSYRLIELDSQDGERQYRIHLYIPRREAPPAGYPVWFMLDGDAAAEQIGSSLLAHLAGNDAAPVIVAIGYRSGLRFDFDSRAYDYTPSLGRGGIEDDQPFSNRRTGGADGFLQLIEQRIKPAVAEIAPLNPSRQGVWGHSYGALFVLHALLAHPASFRCYAAASPSLWWKSGHLLQREADMAGDWPGLPVQVLILRGSAEQAMRQAVDEQGQRRWLARASVPADAARQLSERLAVRGLGGQYLELPEASHGQAFVDSIEPALAWFGRCAADPSH